MVVVKFLMTDYLLVILVLLMMLVVVVKFLMTDYLLVILVMVVLMMLVVVVIVAAVALDLGLQFVMQRQDIFRLLI
jgi:hypothetical protein